MFSFIKKSAGGNSGHVIGTAAEREEKERRKKEKKERKEKEKKEKGSMTADDLLRLDEVHFKSSNCMYRLCDPRTRCICLPHLDTDRIVSSMIPEYHFDFHQKYF